MLAMMGRFGFVALIARASYDVSTQTGAPQISEPAPRLHEDNRELRQYHPKAARVPPVSGLVSGARIPRQHARSHNCAAHEGNTPAPPAADRHNVLVATAVTAYADETVLRNPTLKTAASSLSVMGPRRPSTTPAQQPPAPAPSASAPDGCQAVMARLDGLEGLLRNQGDAAQAPLRAPGAGAAGFPDDV